MKYLILILLISISLHSTEQQNNSKMTECQNIIQNGNIEEIQKRGCCSRHQGVCGCNNNGKVMCCDGTQSPTCTCRGGEPDTNNKMNK